ncbi:DHS-like NAD/FAD-binding domain-containing protein [Pelagophyceae sp. CCMP2097]|nr:DHS-like NAD/FAD-binding domain-containing protein [Pelagophyceae sp. CCMP2097]
MVLGRALGVTMLLLRPRASSSFARRRLSSLRVPRVLHLTRMETELQAPAEPTDLDAAERLRDFFATNKRIVALTGAGISTDSGIPDYRGVKGAYRQGHKPMSHDEFVSSEANRQRYWTRALVGFDAFSRATPNAAHAALAELERGGRVSAVITQNVDGLHKRAGSANVVDLHGNALDVRCLQCGAVSCRKQYHTDLDNENDFLQGAASEAALRPDGDAELDADAIRRVAAFRVLPCGCGGVLQPDVVFFGANVPKERVDRCFSELEQADALICVGSSLAVYSAFRFVVAAVKAGKPVAVLNRGVTRAEVEGLPVLKIEAGVELLSTLVL